MRCINPRTSTRECYTINKRPPMNHFLISLTLAAIIDHCYGVVFLLTSFPAQTFDSHNYSLTIPYQCVTTLYFIMSYFKIQNRDLHWSFFGEDWIDSIGYTYWVLSVNAALVIEDGRLRPLVISLHSFLLITSTRPPLLTTSLKSLYISSVCFAIMGILFTGVPKTLLIWILKH